MTSMIENKIATLKTSQLKEMASLLVNDFREGADEVLSSVLSCLETKMDETSFVLFCEELETT